MEPKSGLEIAFSPEFLTIMPIAVIIDVIGIVLVIFGLDDFWILDSFKYLVLGLLYLQGVRAVSQLVTTVLESIPYVGALPLFTIGFIITAIIDRIPQASAVADKAANAAGSLAGEATKKPGAGSQKGAGPTSRGLEQGASSYGQTPVDRGPGTQPAWTSDRGQEEGAEETPGTPQKKDLEKTEFENYGMPQEPLSEQERRSIFEETPGREELGNARPGPGGDKSVILKDNEVNLKKAA